VIQVVRGEGIRLHLPSTVYNAIARIFTLTICFVTLIVQPILESSSMQAGLMVYWQLLTVSYYYVRLAKIKIKVTLRSKPLANRTTFYTHSDDVNGDNKTISSSVILGFKKRKEVSDIVWEQGTIHDVSLGQAKRLTVMTRGWIRSGISSYRPTQQSRTSRQIGNRDQLIRQLPAD
jgi:hypothetical protein